MKRILIFVALLALWWLGRRGYDALYGVTKLEMRMR